MAIIEFNEVWEGFRRTGKRSLRDFIGSAFSRPHPTPYTLHPDSTLWALKGVSFEVEKGEALGIIGPNGAGKTTILKLLAGVLRPDRGEVKVRGRTSNLIELGMGFHPDLSGEENIYLQGAILGMPRNEIQKRFNSIIDFAELQDFIDMPVKHYSSGMLVRLGFSIAAYVDFDILLIDEVLAVGDESFQNKCFNRIKKFKEQSRTIVFVSHNLGAVARFCDKVILLDKGEIVTEGTPGEVIEKYLQVLEEKEKKKSGQDIKLKRELGRRWGSKEVEIEKVEFVDENLNLKNTFSTGEKIIIRINYNAMERINNPCFGIAIHSESGVHIAGPNNRSSGFEIKHIEGRGEVECIIDSLPLLEGTYLFTVAIHDSLNVYCYDYLDKMFPINIQKTKKEKGLVFIPCKWKIVI